MTSDISPIFSMIRTQSTMVRVNDLLKSKMLPFSASGWDDLISVRLSPAYNKGHITLDDLHSILRESEEYGRQHIYLYASSGSVGANICTIETLKLIEVKLDPQKVNFPRWDVVPDNHEVVDLRLDADESLVIKIAHTRFKAVKEELHSIDPSIQKFAVKQVPVRCLSVAVFRKDGTLEIKIESIESGVKGDYKKELEIVTAELGKLIDFAPFREQSLVNARSGIRAAVKSRPTELTIKELSHRTSQGNRVKFTSGGDTQQLLDDSSINAGIDSTLEVDTNAICESCNVNFLPSEYIQSRLRVTLGERSNEFAVLGKCSGRDYEYVLKTIYGLNKPVSKS